MELNYLIAKHRVVLETGVPEVVRRHLANYAPFEVARGVGDLLYVFRLGVALDPMDRAADHVFESDELVHHIFIGADGGHVIRFQDKFDGRSYLMRANVSWTLIETDMEEGFISDLVLNTMLMFAFAFSGLTKHTMMLHASAVVHDRCTAYLFLGKSGTGKSTHSRLWLDTIASTHLLNGDNPVVRVEADGVVVYGSPWSGKECCYLQESYPLRGVVRLKQAPFNRIELLRPVQAFAALLPSSSVMKWDEERYDVLCRDVMRISSSVPIYCLECLPNVEAARLCSQTVLYEK